MIKTPKFIAKYLSNFIFGAVFLVAALAWAADDYDFIAEDDLVFVVPSTNQVDYSDLNCSNWLEYVSISNSILLSEQKIKDFFYTIGQITNYQETVNTNYYKISFPFSNPIILTIKNTKARYAHNLIGKLEQHAIASAAIADWYSFSPSANILENIRDGQAIKDLQKHDAPVCQNKISQRIFALWPNNVSSNSSNYTDFKKFLSTTHYLSLSSQNQPQFKASIDSLVGVYSRYLSQSLTFSNTFLGQELKTDTLTVFPSNYMIIRNIANYELKLPQPNISEVNRLNDKACELYRQKYDRPFFDAIFANILAFRKIDNYQTTVNKFSDLRDLAIKQKNKYNDLLASDSQDEKTTTEDLTYYRDRCIFWESQCNSYNALILMQNDQNDQARKWLSLNLDPTFNDKIREVATLRLYEILIAEDNIFEIKAFFESMIEKSQDYNEKINWLLKQTNFEMDHELPAQAYQTMETIKTMLSQIPDNEREKWFANNSYVRAYNHIKKLFASDIREEIIPILLDYAKNDEDPSWWLLQVAHLYRCKLRYDQAEKYFLLSTTNFNQNACLDAAMMQYKLSRFAKAIQLFNILDGRTNQDQNLDWRFNALKILKNNNRPAFLDELLVSPTNFVDQSQYHNYQGNIYIQFGEFDQGTNQFQLGINSQPKAIDNYLDLGYQLCRKSDVSQVTKLIDSIQKLDLAPEVKQKLQTDWRYITLYHVSGRPYSLKETHE